MRYTQYSVAILEIVPCWAGKNPSRRYDLWDQTSGHTK